MDERGVFGGTESWTADPSAVGFGSVYAGSDGEFYTSWEVLAYRRNGRWRFCLAHEDGRRLVADTDGEAESLLLLVPVSLRALPEWIDIHVCTDPKGDSRPRTRAVDTR